MDSREDDNLHDDRRAIESITGRSLGTGDWPTDALQPGSRVRVIKDVRWDGPWRQEFIGTVDRTILPQLVTSRVAREGEREYSVAFDEPQIDASGDGPYRKAVIWDRYLKLL